MSPLKIKGKTKKNLKNTAPYPARTLKSGDSSSGQANIKSVRSVIPPRLPILKHSALTRSQLLSHEKLLQSTYSAGDASTSSSYILRNIENLPIESETSNSTSVENIKDKSVISPALPVLKCSALTRTQLVPPHDERLLNSIAYSASDASTSNYALINIQNLPRDSEQFSKQPLSSITNAAKGYVIPDAASNQDEPVLIQINPGTELFPSFQKTSNARISQAAPNQNQNQIEFLSLKKMIANATVSSVPNLEDEDSNGLLNAAEVGYKEDLPIEGEVPDDNLNTDTDDTKDNSDTSNNVTDKSLEIEARGKQDGNNINALLGLEEHGTQDGSNINALLGLQEREKQDGSHINALLGLEETTHNENICCKSCRNILLRISKKLDELSLMKPVGDTIAVKTSALDKLEMLPVTTREDMLAFDEKLIDPGCEEMRVQFEIKMKSLLGKSLQKSVYNILPEILSNELAGECTWVIAKPGKVKLSNYNFPNIISKYLADTFSVSDLEVKKRIQTWLQKSSDRLKANMQKAQREAQVLQ